MQPKWYTSPKLCKTLTGEVVQRKSRKHAYDALEDANGLDGVRPFPVQREDRLHVVTSPVNTETLGQSASPLGTMHLSAFDVRLMPLAYILRKSHCPQRPTAATTQKKKKNWSRPDAVYCWAIKLKFHFNSSNDTPLSGLTLKALRGLQKASATFETPMLLDWDFFLQDELLNVQ